LKDQRTGELIIGLVAPGPRPTVVHGSVSDAIGFQADEDAQMTQTFSLLSFSGRRPALN